MIRALFLTAWQHDRTAIARRYLELAAGSLVLPAGVMLWAMILEIVG